MGWFGVLFIWCRFKWYVAKLNLFCAMPIGVVNDNVFYACVICRVDMVLRGIMQFGLKLCGAETCCVE